MGCDIHLYVERKNNEGTWKPIYEIVTSNGKNVITDEDNDKGNCIYDWLYDNRNYVLFSILANVRNPFGKVNSISRPKGLPNNVSDLIKNKSDEWNDDGHNHSWLTLSELLEFDWNQTITESHVVPEGSCKYADIPDNAIRYFNSDHNYTLYEWQVPYKEEASEFYDVCIPKLRNLTDDPENIRIVFWFDN